MTPRKNGATVQTHEHCLLTLLNWNRTKHRMLSIDLDEYYSGRSGLLVTPPSCPFSLSSHSGYTPYPTLPRRMTMPLTHFWEYGHWLDPYTTGEKIRDHLLRALYGTFYNVKTMRPSIHVNLQLHWGVIYPHARRVPTIQGRLHPQRK